MYKCTACKKTVAKLEENKVRCAYCGARIMIMLRPEVVKRVLAR